MHELGQLAPLGAVRQLGMDAADYGAQGRAIIGHDVAARFGGSMERAAAAIRSRLLVVVSKRDEVVDPADALALARLTGAEILELEGSCGHNAAVCHRATVWPAVRRFLAK